jgi:hypothetical protein
MRDSLMNGKAMRDRAMTSCLANGAVTAALRRLRTRRGGEDGTVTAFVVVFTLALILMAGLVLDGGLTLAAKTQAIDLATFRATGHITLDPAQATTDADNYLAAAGHTGTVEVNGDQVTVTVSITQPMQILSIAGINHLTVTGTGTATAEQNGGAG